MNNVTSVDMGYVDINGVIQGMSFNPYITVEGPIEADEQVIEDFGSIKKRIKAAIDDKMKGYDHKLVYDAQDCNLEPMHLPDRSYLATKSGTIISGQTVAFRRLDYSSFKNTGKHVWDVMAIELEGYLNSLFSPFKFTVNADTIMAPLPPSHSTPYGVAVTRPVDFSYTHGLPRSTSWGCQFIAHGHMSFVQLLMRRDPMPFRFDPDMPFYEPPNVFDLVDRISVDLDGSYFVNKEAHQKTYAGSDYIRYTSRDRGVFELQMPSDTKKLAVLDTDTTVENIASYVWKKWESEFQELRVSGMYISEGLSKGALIGFKV